MNNLISIVLPVHNGAKFIKKTAARILSQDYREIELILVENFSSDDSYRICQDLAASDSRVRLLKCEQRGTSMARKMGVEAAAGKYITFSDQDDLYKNNACIGKMHQAIVEDDAQITQFCFYVRYWGPIKREVRLSKKNVVMSREELYADEALSFLGVGEGRFKSGCLWAKIYDANLLKSAVRDIHGALYHGEDVNLDVRAYFSPELKKASARTEAFYIWTRGIGFSSKDPTNMTLFRDFEYVKEAEFRLIRENALEDRLAYPLHCESMNFYNFIVHTMIRNKYPEAEIIERIREMNGYDFIQKAKLFFAAHTDSEGIRQFAADVTPNEYLAFARAHLPRLSFTEKLRHRIASILNQIEKKKQ